MKNIYEYEYYGGVKSGLSFNMLCGEYGLRKALKISYAYRFVPFLGTHLGLHI